MLGEVLATLADDAPRPARPRGTAGVAPAGAGRGRRRAAGGVVTEIGPEVGGDAAEVIDARGLDLLPGVVDPHVHLNEPGRTEWEGIATGTAALAAGGVTCASTCRSTRSRPRSTAQASTLKSPPRAARAHVDFALWGGLVPGDVDRLDELAARGVVGFKAFMSPSGVDEFPPVDDLTLYEGMARAARARAARRGARRERRDNARGAARAAPAGRARATTSPRGRSWRRPRRSRGRSCSPGDRLRAARRARLAAARGVALVAEAGGAARRDLRDLPPLPVLDEDDVERLGAVASARRRCGPPASGEALWRRVAAGDVDCVATDHSPSPAGAEAGRRHVRRLGRDRGRAVARWRCCWARASRRGASTSGRSASSFAGAGAALRARRQGRARAGRGRRPRPGRPPGPRACWRRRTCAPARISPYVGRGCARVSSGLLGADRGARRRGRRRAVRPAAEARMSADAPTRRGRLKNRAARPTTRDAVLLLLRRFMPTARFPPPGRGRSRAVLSAWRAGERPGRSARTRSRRSRRSPPRRRS